MRNPSIKDMKDVLEALEKVLDWNEDRVLPDGEINHIKRMITNLEKRIEKEEKPYVIFEKQSLCVPVILDRSFTPEEAAEIIADEMEEGYWYTYLHRDDVNFDYHSKED